MYDLIHRGRVKYGDQWAYQYVMHFFMYYDAGQAAAMARAHTELDFWHMQNYGYAGFKRGTERRHFRGDKGKQAMLRFQHMGSPEKIWSSIPSTNYSMLVARFGHDWAGTQTGPYFAWKAMDLLDRCLGTEITLTLNEAAQFMPDEPRKCALTLWPNRTIKESLVYVRDMISDLPAAGAPGKPCGYAEAETILCMIKGFFLTKVHTIGDDVDEKHEQLKDYPDLQALLPPKQDWSQYVRTMDAAQLSA
jgi:hypothetical protein